MDITMRHRLFRGVGIGCISLGLAGCQSYERADLDLGGFRDALALRGTSDEGLEAFAQRLHDQGEQRTARSTSPTVFLSPRRRSCRSSTTQTCA